MTALTVPTLAGRSRPPAAASIARARIALELRLYLREPQQVMFSFAYPVLMMVVFGSVFGGAQASPGVSFPRYFLAGIAATGIMLTSFQAVATGMAEEREQGALARLQVLGTPPIAYFAGEAGQVLLTTVVQLALLLAVAALGYDVPLPTDPDRWLTFGWVVLLGALAGTVLGIAASAVARSARAVTSGVTAFSVLLQFASGVFFVYSGLPPWMRHVAEVFPLKWMTQGMRSVFLPDRAAAAEVGGGWEHPTTALVLTGWVIIGLVLCTRTFRWRRDAG